jgi:hypothetical protein
MENFTTGKNYQGGNITTLEDAGYPDGSQFATFNQTKKFWNLSGKELKGAKSCATLIKIVEKEIVDPETGEKTKKKVPSYFNVFEKNELIAVMESNGTQMTDDFRDEGDDVDYEVPTYKVKQIDWDLVPNFDDRSSVEFNDYYKITNGKASPELIDLVKKHDDWYEVVEGSVKGHSLWGAYQEGNIGERTFEGHSISTGDILIDEDGNQHLLTDGDFELVI